MKAPTRFGLTLLAAIAAAVLSIGLRDDSGDQVVIAASAGPTSAFVK